MAHPFLYPLARAAARRELRRQGKSFSESFRLVDDATDEMVDVAVAYAGVGPVAVMQGLGDGKIIDAILEFLRSEQGQAVIAALVKLLLGLLVL